MSFACNHVPSVEVFKNDQVCVSIAENPRTPDHLVIHLNSGATCFPQVTKKDYIALHQTVKDIYAANPKGFVCAFQPREKVLCAEVLFQRPSVVDEKNVLDKVDVNRYLLFGDQQLTSLPPAPGNRIAFWKAQLASTPKLLPEEDSTGEWELKESHVESATLMVRQHLSELEKKTLTNPVKFDADVESDISTTKRGDCAFCRPSVLQKQTILEHKGVTLMYNMRGGMSFLVMPKRHVQHLSSLTEEEVIGKFEIEQALHAVLTELHSGWNVIIYCQDSPSVGQTVRHSHDQIMAFDPTQIAMNWTKTSLSYIDEGPRSISDEEMDQQVNRFRKLLNFKLD